MNWKEFFDSLGLNGTQWQWRIIRWQNRWKSFKAESWGKKQHVTYQHKFCKSCGALLDRDAKACPQCETKAESWRRQSAARAVGLVVPEASAATPVLLLVNIGIMAMMVLRFEYEGLFNLSLENLRAMGALVPGLYFDGEYWRIVTYGYLHGGLIHIGFNMFALSQVGPMLEREIGTARFFTLYTVTLLGAGAADLVFRGPNAHIVGASGALFGLIGFGITYCHFSGGFLRDNWRGFFTKWAIYGFVIGYAIPGIDNVAHGGGFATGALLGFLIERERLHRDRFTPAWRAAALLCLLATLGAFVWLILERGGMSRLSVVS